MMQYQTSESIVAAIESNHAALMSSSRSLPNVEFHSSPAIRWMITDIPFPLFNAILGARLSLGEVDETVQTIIASAKARKVPLLWWITPSTEPGDLGTRLERHGFAFSGDAPGMALDLARLPEVGPLPAGFSIQVADETTLEQTIQITVDGFGMPGFVTEPFEAWITMLSSTPGMLTYYLGILDGKPVATSLVFVTDDIAGIYNVATLPDARRKGIGAAMTLAPLRDARQRGCRLGILQSSAMGESVYQTLGFQTYCNFAQYLWKPE